MIELQSKLKIDAILEPIRDELEALFETIEGKNNELGEIGRELRRAEKWHDDDYKEIKSLKKRIAELETAKGDGD